VIKSQNAGTNRFTKTNYDSLGNILKLFVAIGTDSSYNQVMSVSGNTVFSQNETLYDDAGNAIMNISAERLSNQTVTGALTTTSGRFVYTSQWYDSQGRAFASADYGTNGGSVLTRPSTVPASSATVRVSKTNFDLNTGRVISTVDPAGRITQTVYDGLGRVVKIIANSTGNGTVSASNPDQNVILEIAYDSLGRLVSRTAVNPTTGNQVTRYVYGTVKTSIVPLIYRNDLLVAEIYPDSNDAEIFSSGVIQNGTDGVTDRIEFQYNRLGELIWKRDQNGTIHQYTYDDLGRMLHDCVTTLGSGVDGSIRRISTTYNEIGQVETITSYSSATAGSGNVVNQIKYEYDSSGLLLKEYQNPNDAVTTSSSYVGYTYDSSKEMRPVSITYPSGTVVNYTYGTSGSLDDLISRVTAMKSGSTTLAEYLYIGTTNISKVIYPVPNLTLDYAVSGTLDRFSQITDHAWKNSSNIDIVRIKHGYDVVGNRLYREDIAATNAGKSFDELYQYDGMSQLIDMQRGTLNSAKTEIASCKNYEDNFIFDATGNFVNYKQDMDGNGTFDLNQSRTHNAVNEILSIAESSTYIAYDKNGNLTKCVKPSNWSSVYTLTYDAWNRLTTVKDGTITVATYVYDGLNRRVKKIIESETRLFYFNQQWQCLEEHIGSTCDMRYIWGLRYIDDLVMYRKNSTDFYVLQDTNWNVVALTNFSGVVQERYNYTSFGKLNVFDASFIPKSASICHLTRSFTGQALDNETGLILYRNRVYHPTLGRFVQRDPIGYDSEDMNLYRYTKNTTVFTTDSSGLKHSRTGICVLWKIRGLSDIMIYLFGENYVHISIQVSGDCDNSGVAYGYMEDIDNRRGWKIAVKEIEKKYYSFYDSKKCCIKCFSVKAKINWTGAKLVSKLAIRYDLITNLEMNVCTDETKNSQSLTNSSTITYGGIVSTNGNSDFSAVPCSEKIIYGK
jgi:RHS repeat-associated protein